SLSRPGGNITGLSLQSTDLAGKRLELFREVVPDLRRLAIMAHVGNPAAVLELAEVQAAARALGLEVATLEIRRAEDIAPAFEALNGRTLYRDRCAHIHPPDSHQYLGSRRGTADDAQCAGVCRSGRSDVLWSELHGPVPARRGVSRQDFAWGEARRHPRRTADQIRSCNQSDHREGARPRRSRDAARPRRRGDRVKRRAFITLLGSAAAWPLTARAEQGERMRRLGVLMGMADDREGQARVIALKQGLQELGWTDGRNVQIETRFAGADAGRIRTQVAELVALAPDVIVGQTTPVIRALRQATSSIPIVMAAINDPVDQGFVSSLAHPGGNITGFTFVDFQMVGKWLEILKEAAPGVSRAALMFNPDTSPHYYVFLRSFEAQPRAIAVEVTAGPVRNTTEVEEALAKLGREPGGGLIVAPDAFTIVHHPMFIGLAQQHRVPAVYSTRAYVAQGALMSYGPDPYDNFRRSASYVDRILKGAKPADLPIQQPTKFGLAINLNSARGLGLQMPA